MSLKEAQKEAYEARASYAALKDALGNGKNAADRKRISDAEARLRDALEWVAEEAPEDVS